MLNDKFGNTISHERAIFPLISFEAKSRKFKCIGTAFFVNTSGVFITAKHVLYDTKEKLFEMMIGLHGTNSGKLVTRQIDQLCIHDSADIAIGWLENKAYDGNGIEVAYDPVSPFILSFEDLKPNDPILSFGYPRVEKEVIEHNTTFNITGIWTHGFVREYCPEGSPLVRNRCYQTSMHIESGASGGPVFKDSNVIGINSTGWHLEEGEEPLSYITPIDHIRSLQIETENGITESIDSLIDRNFVIVK